MNFQFADKKDGIDEAVGFTRDMPQFNDGNVDQLIRSHYIIDEFDKEQIKKYIDVLSRVDTLNVILRSKSFEGQTDQVAEWYETKYKVERFSPELIKLMQSPNCEIKEKKLDYPPKNNLIAKDFSLLGMTYDSEPKLLKRWD
jgi:secreted Zn-dependent insulinase-like peptidase